MKRASGCELGAEVAAIERHGDRAARRARRIDARSRAGIVVMATGVAPRSELLAAIRVALDDGAVPVDAAMRTAVAGVLAAGDVCKAYNVPRPESLRVEHWGDALDPGRDRRPQRQAGADASWDEVPGFWSTIGDHTLKYAAWGDGYDAASLRAPGRRSLRGLVRPRAGGSSASSPMRPTRSTSAGRT